MFASNVKIKERSDNGTRPITESLVDDAAPNEWIGRGDVNLSAYVGADPINFTDPLGLYPVCVTTEISHTEADGTIVVGLRVVCGDNGLTLPDIDQLVGDSRSEFDFLAADESFFSAFPDRVESVKADFKIECAGSDDVTYGADRASFDGGIPGHVHTDGFRPYLGPDDGVAARTSGLGVAYMASRAGTYRINVNASGRYSAALLSGGWGTSMNQIISTIAAWNRYGGQAKIAPASRGPSGSGSCTKTVL